MFNINTTIITLKIKITLNTGIFYHMLVMQKHLDSLLTKLNLHLHLTTSL